MKFTRRRFAVLSVALAPVLAGLAFAASPAQAATGSITCLDANAQQVYNYGAVIQWTCNDVNDPYQEWKPVAVASNPNLPPPPAGSLVQLENVGALDNDNAADCLDANAQQVYNGGSVIQWGCNAGDTFQQWILTQNSADNFVIQNYGAYLRGAADCLDANAQQVYNGGSVIQYGCNASDPFQQWKPIVDPKAGIFLLESVGS